jgi:hypothetical protein
MKTESCGTRLLSRILAICGQTKHDNPNWIDVASLVVSYPTFYQKEFLKKVFF